MKSYNLQSESEIISQKIKLIMNLRDLKREDLAELWEVTKDTVSHIRRGITKADGVKLIVLCKEHRIDPRYFTTDEMTIEEADLDTQRITQNSVNVAIMEALFENPNKLNGMKKELAQLISAESDPEVIKAILQTAKVLTRHNEDN